MLRLINMRIVPFYLLISPVFLIIMIFQSSSLFRWAHYAYGLPVSVNKVLIRDSCTEHNELH